MLNGEYTVLVENMWLTDILSVILLLIPFFLIFYNKKYLFGYYVISIVANFPVIFVMSFGFSYEIIIAFFIIISIIIDLINNRKFKYTTTKETFNFIIVLLILLVLNLGMALFNFNKQQFIERSFVYLVNIFILFVFTYFLTNRERLETVKLGFVIGAVLLVFSMFAEMGYAYYELNINNLRPAGLLLDPNVAAFALNLSLIISFYQPREDSAFSDLVSVASKLLILFGIFLTVSRSGYIGTLIILILVLIYYSRGKKSWIPATTVSIFIIMYFLFFKNVNSFYENIIQIIDLSRVFPVEQQPGTGPGFPGMPIDIDYSNSRLDILEGAYIIFRNHFYTGVGIGNVTTHMKMETNLEMNSHNLYLQLLVESGFVMLFGFVLLLVYLLKLLKNINPKKKYFMFLIILVIAVEGMFNHNILNINIIWLIIAFFISVAVVNAKYQISFVVDKKTFKRRRKIKHKGV